MAINIRTVGVAGSGTMGAGIAIVAARAGFKTIVFDTQQVALDRARKQTEGFFAKSVERRKLSQPQVDTMLTNLSGTTRIEDLAACDIVIEAVFENLKVKHELLAQLNQACPPQTLFASNTSTLSITEIAAGSGRDERFVGMHFCLPAQLMKLVEMSPGLRTSDETFQTAWDFCKAMGQIPVKTKDNPGFILNYFLVRQPRSCDAAIAAAKAVFEGAGLQVALCGDFAGRIIDRLVRPYYNAVLTRLDEGLATADDLDTTLKLGLGYPEGPISLLERTGLEYHCEATQDLFEAYGDAAYAPARRARVAHAQAVVKQHALAQNNSPFPASSAGAGND